MVFGVNPLSLGCLQLTLIKIVWFYRPQYYVDKYEESVEYFNKEVKKLEMKRNKKKKYKSNKNKLPQDKNKKIFNLIFKNYFKPKRKGQSKRKRFFMINKYKRKRKIMEKNSDVDSDNPPIIMIEAGEQNIWIDFYIYIIVHRMILISKLTKTKHNILYLKKVYSLNIVK